MERITRGIALSLGAIALGILPAIAATDPHSPKPSNEDFVTVEQPLPLKVGVTLGGLGLIALELWWFLGSTRKSEQD